jgi:single-stranded DNA-binding protein
VKATQRIKDDTAEGGWRDGKEFKATANIYDKPAQRGQTRAENVFESIQKGDLVVIIGDVVVREYDKGGVTQKSIEIDVESIGPSLRFRTTPHGGTRNRSSESGDTRQATNTGGGGNTTVTAPDTTDDEPPF